MVSVVAPTVVPIAQLLRADSVAVAVPRRLLVEEVSGIGPVLVRVVAAAVAVGLSMPVVDRVVPFVAMVPVNLEKVAVPVPLTVVFVLVQSPSVDLPTIAVLPAPVVVALILAAALPGSGSVPPLAKAMLLVRNQNQPLVEISPLPAAVFQWEGAPVPRLRAGQRAMPTM